MFVLVDVFDVEIENGCSHGKTQIKQEYIKLTLGINYLVQFKLFKPKVLLVIKYRNKI